MIKAVQNDEKIPADWTGTLATGSVVLTEVNEQAAAEGTQEAIDAAAAELKDGTRHVFDITTFTVNKEAVNEDLMADVDTDANYEADTKVVSDGYFHESEYRSAPYFQLEIDGITLLDRNYGD